MDSSNIGRVHPGSSIALEAIAHGARLGFELIGGGLIYANLTRSN
jgi:hypothetical protein